MGIKLVTQQTDLNLNKRPLNMTTGKTKKKYLLGPVH